jgi:hypothetical protein
MSLSGARKLNLVDVAPISLARNEGSFVSFGIVVESLRKVFLALSVGFED